MARTLRCDERDCRVSEMMPRRNACRHWEPSGRSEAVAVSDILALNLSLVKQRWSKKLKFMMTMALLIRAPPE